MSGWLSRLFDTSAVPQDYTAPANQLGPLARQVMANPVGTEQVGQQSLTNQRGGFDPVVDPSVARWPGRPMTQSEYDAMRTGSLDLFNQAALVAGSPAAEEGAAVGAIGRRPVPMEPAPPGAPTGGAPEVWSPPQPPAPAMVGDAPGGKPGFTAYHGSPHDFPPTARNPLGAFDTSKIGTGEGAQAYGHGLYFAENEGVAKGYRDQLAPQGFEAPTLSGDAKDWLRQVQRDVPNATLDDVREYAHSMHNPSEGADFPSNQVSAEIHQALDEGKIKQLSSGHMYEVNVNADPAHFLDWDKPLSEQSAQVQQALRDNPRVAEAIKYSDNPDNPTGQQIHNAMVSIAARKGGNGDVIVGESLRDAGIPGIRYLDAGSRGAGSGTRNAVVFDANTLEIIRKYGIAGLLGGTGAVAGTQQPSQ